MVSCAFRALGIQAQSTFVGFPGLEDCCFWVDLDL